MKILYLLIFIFHYCSDQTEISQGKSISELSLAVLYKQSECGNSPNYIIPPPKKPFKYGVDACVFSIIKSTCPFTQYPIICIEMYKIDVKGAGPKIDQSFIDLLK